LADLVEGACIGTAMAREHIVAEDEFAQRSNARAASLRFLRRLFRNRRVDFFLMASTRL
jgi:hypothetical protein